MSRFWLPGISVEAPGDSFSMSCAYRLVPLTLSRLRSPARIACMSPEVSKVLSIRYPSMMDMPPPCPWVVTRGIPARHRASTSRWMVRRDTSKVRAS